MAATSTVEYVKVTGLKETTSVADIVAYFESERFGGGTVSVVVLQGRYNTGAVVGLSNVDSNALSKATHRIGDAKVRVVSHATPPTEDERIEAAYIAGKTVPAEASNKLGATQGTECSTAVKEPSSDSLPQNIEEATLPVSIFESASTSSNHPTGSNTGPEEATQGTECSTAVKEPPSDSLPQNIEEATHPVSVFESASTSSNHPTGSNTGPEEAGTIILSTIAPGEGTDIYFECKELSQPISEENLKSLFSEHNLHLLTGDSVGRFDVVHVDVKEIIGEESYVVKLTIRVDEVDTLDDLRSALYGTHQCQGGLVDIKKCSEEAKRRYNAQCAPKTNTTTELTKATDSKQDEAAHLKHPSEVQHTLEGTSTISPDTGLEPACLDDATSRSQSNEEGQCDLGRTYTNTITPGPAVQGVPEIHPETGDDEDFYDCDSGSEAQLETLKEDASTGEVVTNPDLSKPKTESRPRTDTVQTDKVQLKPNEPKEDDTKSGYPDLQPKHLPSDIIGMSASVKGSTPELSLTQTIHGTPLLDIHSTTAGITPQSTSTDMPSSTVASRTTSETASTDMPSATAGTTPEQTSPNVPSNTRRTASKPTSTDIPSTTAGTASKPTATDVPSTTAGNTPGPEATDVSSTTAGTSSKPTSTDVPSTTAGTSSKPTATDVPSTTAGTSSKPTSTDVPSTTAGTSSKPTATDVPSTTAGTSSKPTATDVPSTTAGTSPKPTATDVPSTTAGNTPGPEATDIRPSNARRTTLASRPMPFVCCNFSGAPTTPSSEIAANCDKQYNDRRSSGEAETLHSNPTIPTPNPSPTNLPKPTPEPQYILVTCLIPSMSTEDIVSYFQSYRCGAGTVTEMVFTDDSRSAALLGISRIELNESHRMFQGRHQIGKTKVSVVLSETPPSEEQRDFAAYTYDENEKKANWFQQSAAATDHEENTAGFSAPSTVTSRLRDIQTTDWPETYDYLSPPFNAKEQTLYIDILVTGLTPSMSTEDIVSYFQSYRCGAGTVTEMVFYNHDKSIASVKIYNQNHQKLFQGSLIIHSHRMRIRCINPPPPPRDQALRVYTHAINHMSHSSAELGGNQSVETRPQGKEPSTSKAANSINHDQPIPGNPPLKDSSKNSTRGPLHQEGLPGLEIIPDYTRNDLSREGTAYQMGNRGTTKHFNNNFPETQALPVTEQPRSNTSGSQLNSTDNYRSVSEMIRLKKGILTDHMADVYVNTAHFALDLKHGAVAQSLLKAGGPQLQKECRDYVQQHGKVSDWGHAVTRGGNLRCSHVIHAVAAHATTRDSKQGMSTMITNIMAECEHLGATSVAFPAIGTGQLGFKIDTVASIMVQMIASFLQNNPPSSLKTVLLVLFDDKTLSAFAKQCKELPTAPQPSSASGEQNQSKQHSSTGAHVEWTNSQPVLRPALLSNAHRRTPHPVTNATATPYSRMNDSKKSAFSASHTTTAPLQGCVHESAMSTSSQQTQAPGGSASLQSFQLGSVNVQIIHGDITNEECDGLISTSTHDLKLMSFGVMGALLKKGGPELQRDCKEAVSKQGMLRSTHVVVTGVGRPGGLKCSKILHILAPDNPRKLKSVVHTALKKANEQKLSVVALPAIGTGAHGFTPEESAKGICEAITEFGMSKPNYSKVLKLVLFEEGHYKQFSYGFNAAAAVVSRSQSKGWFQRIFSSGKTSSQSGNNTATIGSSQIPVAGVVYYDIFQWQWKSSKSGAFIHINPVANEKIEAAYLSRQTELRNVMMVPDEPPFTLDFGNMIAVQNMGPFKSVEIQRVSLKVEQESMQSGPGTSAINSRPEVIDLHPDSQEFKNVLNGFQRSMIPQHSDVKCIQRISNPSLWTRYSSRKAAMTQGHPTGGWEEKWLFHSCPPEKIQEVQQHGFNRTYSNRQDIGKGIYFTEDSQSSLTYGHNHTLKYVFLARVLTGNYTKGNYAVTTPPPKIGRHPQGICDSVVDDVGNPKVFVVFSEDQAYPEYLIIYATHY